MYFTIKKEKIAIVGLGYVGMPIAVAFAKKVNVIGFDLNEKKIDLYKAGIRTIVDLLKATPTSLVSTGVFKHGKSLDKMITAISAIKVLNLSNIILSLQFDGVGRTISKEVEKYYIGASYDFSGIDYSIREDIVNKDSDLNKAISNIVEEIVAIGTVEILMGEQEVETVDDVTETFIFEMTGSPKPLFSDKKTFISEVEKHGYKYGKLNKDTDYLITDDLSSTTGKMAKIAKLNAKGADVKVLTYEQLIELIKNK
jgi:NAD-dependent DNA ligase